MPSTGLSAPGAGASVDRAGSTAWTSPENIVGDDAADATAAVPTDYLVASNYGLSVPVGAVVLGVVVRVEASETGAGNSNYIPQLISEPTTPTLIGSAKGAVTVNGTTPAISDSGGAADLWGATLTQSLVTSSNFGVAIWSTDTTNTLAVDYVFVNLTWTGQRMSALGCG